MWRGEAFAWLEHSTTICCVEIAGDLPHLVLTPQTTELLAQRGEAATMIGREMSGGIGGARRRGSALAGRRGFE